MTWFRKHHPAEPAPRKLGAAHLAKLRAQDDLRKTNARWPEVDRISTSLRELGEQNHFAASVRMIFQGGQPNE